MKKVISLLLAGVMMVSAVPAAYATNDYKAGTQVVYTADDAANESWAITVPAKLNPGQSGTVTLAGSWPENKTIMVTADSTVTLTNSILSTDQKVLDIDFIDDNGVYGISEKGNNTKAQEFTAPIKVAGIENALFGTWSGKFNYNVESSVIDQNETSGIKFYQPYRYTDIYDGDRIVTEFVFHENGAVDTYESYYGADGSMWKEGASIPEGTCTYDDEYVYVEGEPAFTIGQNGSYVEMDGEGTFTLVPTTVQYIQYGETYVNDWIVEEDYPYVIFAEDGSAKYYGEGGAEQNFPVGTFVYKDRYIEFSGENCAVYPDGTKIVLGDILLEIGCPHKNTERRGESETYTGDKYCVDCGKFLRGGECKHTNTEIRGANEEYTGDTYCVDCGELLESGESLLIVFYIDKYTYGNSERYALPGMTWEEWLNSKYSVGYRTSFMINGDYWDGTWLEAYGETEKMMSVVYQSDDGTISVGSDYLAYNENVDDSRLWRDSVLCDDVIIEGYHYNIWPYK